MKPTQTPAAGQAAHTSHTSRQWKQLAEEAVTDASYWKGKNAALVAALRNVSQDLADCGSVQEDTLAMIPAALATAKE